METFIWILTVMLLMAGLAGTLLPLLPGTTLILLAAVLHKLALPDLLTWWTVGAVAALWALSVVLDVLGSLIGTRLGGGGKWGMAGAATGSFVGVFFSLPAVLLGAFIGAATAERLLADKRGDDALRAGIGAGIGFLIGTIAKVFVAVAMIVALVIDWIL